ncbi:MAG TPA: PA14 domain-containing protein [Polyangiaceae bacterium]|nr:PA14 domain-containing protein [Polyangiaceae bacterium]
MFGKPLRLALALALLAIGNACSHGGHDSAPFAGTVDAGDKPLPMVDPCETPNKGCSCENADEVIDCGQVERRSGDYVSCTIGKRTCDAKTNTWGECIGDRIATLNVPASKQKTQGLGTSSACTDNPCDPYCQRIVDDAKGLDLDGGPFINDGGLTMKPSVPLAPGSGCNSLAITPATQDVTVTAMNTNLKAEYFNQIDKTVTQIPSTWTVTATRTEGNINNNYGSAAPGVTGIGATLWSARWTGSVIPTTTEAYTFYAKAGDGVRLWINGTLVVNQWKDQSTTEYTSTAINLTAGVPALFRYEFYQNTGSAAAYLSWSSPSVAKQIIPATAIGDPTGKRSRLILTPANPTFSVALQPPGCYTGMLAPAWSLDRYDVATVTNGAVNLLSAVPGTLNVTAYLGQYSATAKLNVKVNVVDSSTAPANAVTNFAKTVGGTDPAKILYPYANTVLPLGMMPPVLQWDNGGVTADAVQVSLLYPATGTATFTWSAIIPEPSTPSATIPQAVWKDFENAGKGADVAIKLQRLISGVPAPALSRSLHFSTAPVRGLIYYTQYNRNGSTNMMVADPSSTAAAKSAFASVDGCPVCHTVSANGSYFATSDKSWSATNGGLSKISGGVLNPIADFVSNTSYRNGANDWRGFAWAPLTPDGSLALAANNFWGNTNQNLVGINSARQITVPNTIQSGGTGTGLLAKYFPNKTFTAASPLWKRIDPIVNFDFGTASPGGLVPTDYSVRRTGQIQAFTSEPYTFQIDTTDAVKLTVNGTTVIDALTTPYQPGSGVAPKTFTSSPIAMTAGTKVSIQLDQVDNQYESSIKLSWSSPTVPLMVVPQTQLYPADGVHGLDVSYYANATATAPVALQRLEPDVYADWGAGSPATETTLPTDNFSSVWQGQIEAPYTGNVTFCADADDTLKVTVGSTVVINLTTATTGYCGTTSVSMTQGTLYSIKVEHVEKAGSTASTAMAKLRWKSGSGSSTVTERIPTANFYAPASYVPPTNGLTVSYYGDQVFNGNLAQNPTLQGGFTRYDATINNNYGAGRTEFSQLTSSDNLSARWTGLLTAPCSGVYEFQTASNVDDGGRLWIDQIRIANTWTAGAFSGATYLDAGDHDFKFGWYEATGNAAVQLQWKVNCQTGATFVSIPSTAFKPTGDTNRSGTMRDGGDNGNGSSYVVWQTPQSTGTAPVDVSGNSAGVWGLGKTVMMVPSFSPDGTKLVFVDGDSSAGAGWRKGLSTFDFDQTNKLFKRRRSVANTWPLGDVIKWPTFESDSHSVIYQTTTPTDACCTKTDWTKYGYMGPTNYFEDPGRLWSLDSTATTPTPVALTNLNSGERPIDANKAYQATVSPRAAGGYRWVVFTSTRPYGNTFNLPAVQQDYSNLSSYTQITNYTQVQSALWIAAVDDTPSAGVDRSHPAFLLPNQNYSTSGANYLNERGFWVLDSCKTTGTAAANTCEVDEDCCGGLTSPKTAVCKIDTPVTDPPTRHCGTAPPVGMCVADGGVCATTNDCCIGSVCLTGTCAPPPPLVVLGPANYERNYTAVCEDGTKPVWRFFDWQTITPSANSKIEFYAQTSATGKDFATLPVYPTAVTTPGVVKLGTASGAPNTSWVGSDVGALLIAAGYKSQQYLKVTVRMVPTDGLTAAPTLTNWRQNYSCVPAE